MLQESKDIDQLNKEVKDTESVDTSREGVVLDDKASFNLNKEDISLKSNEVKEVLGSVPGWIIRSGILMTAIITLLFLFGAYFFQYPDLVPAEVSIKTQILPASVIAKQSGKIIHMITTENKQVEKGEHLAVIENTASYEDIQIISNWFKEFNTELITNNRLDSIPLNYESLSLGSLQNPFADLQRNVKKYFFNIDQASIEKKINQLREKIIAQEDLLKNLEYKNKLKKKSFALSKKKYAVDKRLHKQKVITGIEFDEASNAYLAARLEVAKIEEDKADQESILEELNYKILELGDQGEETEVELKELVRTTAVVFKENLKNWHEQYVLSAPITGKVSFYKFWSEIQEVSSGDEVMVILPNTKDIFAYAYLASDNSGKVVKGQKVRIELKDFPYQQYGSVFGTVAYKSEISRDGKYFLRINLPNGLVTNVGKELKFSQEMSGNAFITTKELRLLERLYYSTFNNVNTHL